MVVRDVGTEIGFESLIGTFREAIGLRVIGGGVLELDLKVAGEFGPESGHERRTAVGNDGRRKAMIAEDSVEEEPRESRRVEGLGGGDEMSISGETVANDPDGVVPMRARELDDVVHGDVLPWAVGYVERG